MQIDFLNFGKYDILKDVQILTPTKKGTVGTKNLNKELQKVLNPKSSLKAEKEFGDIVFREGDKVMQTKNNYDIPWESADRRNYGTGVFNGDLGIISNIIDNVVEVTFDDDKIVRYETSVLEELEHAYAITIHKSQGSEFPVIVMPITNGPAMLYTRNLLYTGVTRAKKLLIIVGKESIVDYMINNNNSKSRNTGLKEKMANFLAIWQ